MERPGEIPGKQQGTDCRDNDRGKCGQHDRPVDPAEERLFRRAEHRATHPAASAHAGPHPAHVVGELAGERVPGDKAGSEHRDECYHQNRQEHLPRECRATPHEGSIL